MAGVRSLSANQCAGYAAPDCLPLGFSGFDSEPTPMRGALKPALHRPRTGHCDTKLQSPAAVLHSLAQGDPFVDGMNEAAFAVVDIFLRNNACQIAADSTTFCAFAMELFEAKAYDTDDLVPWMRTHVRLRSSHA